MKPDWIEGYYDSVSYQISIWYILYTLHSLLCKTLLCSETGRVGNITIYHIFFHNGCWIYIHIYVYVYIYNMGINICAYSSDHGVSWDRKRHHSIYFPTEPGPDGIDNQILGIISCDIAIEVRNIYVFEDIVSKLDNIVISDGRYHYYSRVPIFKQAMSLSEWAMVSLHVTT